MSTENTAHLAIISGFVSGPVRFLYGCICVTLLFVVVFPLLFRQEHPQTPNKPNFSKAVSAANRASQEAT
jgi:hypothetical protein